MTVKARAAGFALAPLALALTGLSAAQAPAMAQVAHYGDPKAAIASSVFTPLGADTLYVSGMTPPVVDPAAPKGTKASFGDTKTQTLGVLQRLEDELKAHGMTFGDVVMMRVYLVGDPDLGGKMDFAGMMAAYTTKFGTPEQPNKPARVTTQVASLVGPGQLVEIELQASKAKPAAKPAKKKA
jgi:enamine deaminase RidA (YjgF/YER057c/UK114 family)